MEYEQALEHLEHPYALSEILWALEWDYRDQEVYLKFSHYILLHLLPLLTPRNITFLYSVREWFGSTSDHRVVLVHCYWIDCWLKHPKRLLTDDEFTADFKIRYELYRLCNFLSYKEEPYPLEFPIRAVDFGRACQMGLLSEDTLMVELMDRPLSPVLIEEAVDFFYKKDQRRNGCIPIAGIMISAVSRKYWKSNGTYPRHRAGKGRSLYRCHFVGSETGRGDRSRTNDPLVESDG